MITIGYVCVSVSTITFLSAALLQKRAKILRFEEELKSREEELKTSQMEAVKLSTQLQEQAKSFEQRLSLVNESKDKLKDVLKSVSFEALEKMEEKAQKEEQRREKALSDLVSPVKNSLGKLDEKMAMMEKERKGDKESLSQQMMQVLASEKDILKETKGLKDALSKPEIRGIWGEMQLKRAVEISGMMNYCDFVEQSSTEKDGSRIRPDMLINLAGHRKIIVDAKAPLEGFLKALSTDSEEERKHQLERHARHLKTHIIQLSKKKYYEGFAETPEFVVLFLPSEVFFSAAMQVDASLMEYGAKSGVILATPTTLIGLLRSVAYGWKSETIAIHAKKIQTLGEELYKRLLDMSKHLHGMGKSLNTAVEGYNKTIGTFERRVLSSARKFDKLGSLSNESKILSIEPIDVQTRTPDLSHIKEEDELHIDS